MISYEMIGRLEPEEGSPATQCQQQGERNGEDLDRLVTAVGHPISVTCRLEVDPHGAPEAP